MFRTVEVASESLEYWRARAAGATDVLEKQHCAEYIAHYENDLAYLADFAVRHPPFKMPLLKQEPPPLKFSEIVWFPYYCFFLVIHTLMIMFGWLAFGTFVFAVLYAIFGG